MKEKFKIKKINKFLIVFLLIISSFAYSHVCQAAVLETFNVLLGAIAEAIVKLANLVVGLVIFSIVKIASYNGFINQPQIVEAWKIMRDFCNMLFILVLLVIAFASILRLENYSMKRWLPKVVIMTVLINFSRTIVGVLIDISQIVMLTFINSFSDGGGNFVAFLQIDDYLDVVQNASKTLDPNTVAIFYLLAAVFSIVSLIALLAVLVVFVMRLIYLWIYVVLSPLAFLMMAFPDGQKYASQYWGDLIKYLTNGPVLAFFIWLALSTLSKISEMPFTAPIQGLTGVTEISQGANFMSFVLAIGFLVGGLMMSSQIGGMGASWGSGMVSKVKNTGMGWAKKPVNLGKDVAKAGAFKVGRFADDLQVKAQKGIAGAFGNDSYEGKSLNYRMIKEGWQKNKAETMRNYEQGKSSNWAATFDKYTDMKQYGAWRKGEKQIISDGEKAKKLDEENKMMHEKMNVLDMKDDEKMEIRQNLMDPTTELYKSKLDKYIKLADENLSKEDKKKWAKEQIEEDIRMFSAHDTESIKNSIQSDIDKNSTKAKKLRDHVKMSLFGMDHSKFQVEDSVFRKSAIAEDIDKQQAEMKKRTDGEGKLVTSEIFTALQKGDESKLTAGLRIMAEKNDLNELLKDSRFIDLMVEKNGILEKLADDGHFGDHVKGDADAIKGIKEDFRKNPVTPAYVQAITQGLYSKIGVSDGKAAQHASIIGNRGIAAGNTLSYAMSNVDAHTGQYKFDKMHYDADTGKVSSSEDRREAMVGKYNNFDSQSRMKGLHPDAIIGENMDGGAAGIHAEGEAILKSLTFHDLGEMRRMRGDTIAKIASSKQSMRDFKRIVDELEANNQEDQARVIKNFAAYIHAKHKGEDLNENNQIDVDKVDEIFKKATEV